MKMKFKLKAGQYREGGVTHQQGSVVVSELALDERFGAAKFQRLDANSRSAKRGPKAPDVENFDSEDEEAPVTDESDIEGEEVSEDTSNSELNDMTIAELKQFADGDEIDLEGARNKPEILRVIRRTLKERAKANG
jgi:hypothetical protein